MGSPVYLQSGDMFLRILLFTSIYHLKGTSQHLSNGIHGFLVCGGSGYFSKETPLGSMRSMTYTGINSPFNPKFNNS